MIADLAAYNAAVAATSGGKPLVIQFAAAWCPPCQRIGPVFKGKEGEYKQISMKRIDVDNNSEAALAADIECMPTFKVYKNGAEVEKIEGASEQSLVELLGRAQAS